MSCYNQSCMKILIVGCGYLGTALGVRLAEAGAEVWGIRRDWSAGEKNAGAPGLNRIRKIEADLLRPESLEKLPTVDFAVLCQAPGREGDSYERTYYKGTRNLIEAMKKSAACFILVSSTRVYSTKDGSWVDEDTDPSTGGEVNENSRWLLETEDWALRNSSCMVFRLGGIYGPGRNRLASTAKSRAPRSGYVNRIHVEDAVSGIRLLMDKGKPGEIYLGVDDCPSADAEAGAPVLGKRCSNQKIKRLGLSLKYPTYKEGYSALLKIEGAR